MVYARPEADGAFLTFGVSGVLYNANVLFYDQQTGNLWQQLNGQATVGNKQGEHLNKIPSVFTTWLLWKESNPSTLVLSTRTGFRINYDLDPYADVSMMSEKGNWKKGNYWKDDNLWFQPLNSLKLDHQRRFRSKARLVVVEVNHQLKAYPIDTVLELGGTIRDEFAGTQLTVQCHGKREGCVVTDKEGFQLPAHEVFWFVWYAFYPNGSIFEPPKSDDGSSSDIGASSAPVSEDRCCVRVLAPHKNPASIKNTPKTANPLPIRLS